MNAFRTLGGQLDRQYLRTCAIYALLKRGCIDKAGALELARRPIRGLHIRPDRLNNTIEIWLTNGR